MAQVVPVLAPGYLGFWPLPAGQEPRATASAAPSQLIRAACAMLQTLTLPAAAGPGEDGAGSGLPLPSSWRKGSRRQFRQHWLHREPSLAPCLRLLAVVAVAAVRPMLSRRRIGPGSQGLATAVFLAARQVPLALARAATTALAVCIAS